MFVFYFLMLVQAFKICTMQHKTCLAIHSVCCFSWRIFLGEAPDCAEQTPSPRVPWAFLCFDGQHAWCQVPILIQSCLLWLAIFCVSKCVKLSNWTSRCRWYRFPIPQTLASIRANLCLRLEFVVAEFSPTDLENQKQQAQNIYIYM